MAKLPQEGEVEENKGGKQVRFTVSPQVWRYLSWLSRNSVLGATEHEVARQILVDRLAEMRQEDYKFDLHN